MDHPSFNGAKIEAIDHKNPPKPIPADEMEPSGPPPDAFHGERPEAIDHKNPPKPKAAGGMAAALLLILFLILGRHADAQFSNNVPGVITNLTTPGFNTNPPAPTPFPVTVWSGTNNPNGLYTGATGSLYNQFDATGTNFIAEWIKRKPGTTNWVLKGIGGLLTSAINWVDPINGNNATAVRGSQQFSSTTISNAVKLSLAGDLVWVRPGLYAEHNLLKPGVNYHGDLGANIQYKQTGTNEDVRGIFDDSAIGSTTNYIDWRGSLELDGLTNTVVVSNYWGAFPANAGTVFPNNSAVGSLGYGAITLTNANSRVIANIAAISVGNLMSGATPTAISLNNQNGSIINVGTISNSLSGVAQTVLNYDGFGDNFTFNNLTILGVYWFLGEAHINCTVNSADNNAIWCDEPAAETSPNNFYYTGDVITSKIYTTLKTYNAVLWLDVKYINDLDGPGSQASGIAVDFFGGGKVYLNSDKITSTHSGSYCIEFVPNSGVSNTLAWITAQKVEAASGATWLNQQDGTLFASVSHFSDGGGAGANGLTVAGNGEAHINGLDAYLNATPLVLKTSPQLLELKGFTLTDTNGSCIALGTNNLTLVDVQLVPNANSFAISATGPQTINFFGGSSPAITNIINIFGFYSSSNIVMSLVNDITFATNSLPTITAGNALIGGGSAAIFTNFGAYSDSFIPVQIITGAGPIANTNLFNITFGTPINKPYTYLASFINSTNVNYPAQVSGMKIPYNLMTSNGCQVWQGSSTVLNASTTNYLLFVRVTAQ